MKTRNILLVVFCLSLFTIGCMPQSVKRSGEMAEQAIFVAKTSAESVAKQIATAEPGTDTRDLAAVVKSDIVKPLEDAEILIKPVLEIIGSPQDSVIYDKGSDAASILAEQALSQARMKNWIENKFKGIREFLPGALKKLIPPPVEQKSDLVSIIQMSIAAFIGSGGMYGGAKAIKKVAAKKVDRA